jgi:lipopolysaccharide biosynthesis glycosyltransferase
MEKDKVIIPIALATDQRYAIPTYVAMESVMLSSGKDNFYDFYILINHTLNNEEIQLFTALSKTHKNCNVNFINTGNAFDDVKITLPNVNSNATFFRLLLMEYLNYYDKCIYLDSDVLVNQDICELYDTELEGDYIAGVKAVAYVTRPDGGGDYLKQTGLKSLDQYINAGVLVMNLKKMREDDIKSKIEKLMFRCYPSQDQDILNIVCYDRIRFLPFKYNVMTKYAYYDIEKYEEIFSEEQIVDAWMKPAIIHYADIIKPWDAVLSIFAEHWWEVLMQTPIFSKFIKEHWSIILRNLKEGYGGNILKYKNLLDKLRYELLEEIKDYKYVIIYGAGFYGRRVYDQLQEDSINIYCFAVTKLENNLEKTSERVCSIDELLDFKDDALIIIGTSELYQNEIKEILIHKNFKNIKQLSESKLKLLCNDIGKKTLYDKLMNEMVKNESIR